MAEGKKVLVIEDDKFLSSLLKSRLEKEGFAVEQAMDGEEGISKIRDFKPDLVLLDLIMPKYSGFELLENVKIDPELARIPVVVASNLGQDSDIEKARQLGVEDYYVKATTPVESIVGVVKNFLEAKEQIQQQ